MPPRKRKPRYRPTPTVIILVIVALVTLLFEAEDIIPDFTSEPAPVLDSAIATDLDVDLTERKKIRVLFIGNSHTYSHNMPHMVHILSQLQEQYPFYLETASVTKGGAGLMNLLQEGKAMNAIQSEHWDVIIFQGLSWVMLDKDKIHSFDTALNEFIQKIDREKTKILLYSTWARQKNSPFYEQIGTTYEAMLNTVNQKYYTFARHHKTGVVYTGSAFHQANQQQLPIYEPDGNHATPLGMFLIANLFVQEILGTTTLDCKKASEAIDRISQKECQQIHKILYATEG